MNTFFPCSPISFQSLLSAVPTLYLRVFCVPYEMARANSTHSLSAVYKETGPTEGQKRANPRANSTPSTPVTSDDPGPEAGPEKGQQLRIKEIKNTPPPPPPPVGRWSLELGLQIGPVRSAVKPRHMRNSPQLKTELHVVDAHKTFSIDHLAFLFYPLFVMKSFLLPLLSAVCFVALTPASVSAAVVVGYDLSDILTGQTIANAAQTTVSGGSTIYTSTIGFNTVTPYLSPSASYVGPAIYGGAYRISTYAEAQTENPGTWFQTRTDLGFYSRRNGPSTSNGLVRISSLLETGEGVRFDADSEFSIFLTGAFLTNANTTGYLFLENNGLLYRGTTDFDPSGSAQTFDSLDIANFQQVTVDGSTLALTSVGSTVLGSTFGDITKIGYYVEVTGGSGPSPQLRSFSASLAAIPEPSASLLLLGTGGAFLLLRRRRH